MNLKEILPEELQDDYWKSEAETVASDFRKVAQPKLVYRLFPQWTGTTDTLLLDFHKLQWRTGRSITSSHFRRSRSLCHCLIRGNPSAVSRSVPAAVLLGEQQSPRGNHGLLAVARTRHFQVHPGLAMSSCYVPTYITVLLRSRSTVLK